MKEKYLLFAGYEYYPMGGWSDFIDEFDSLEAAKIIADEKPNNILTYDWAQVVLKSPNGDMRLIADRKNETWTEKT